MAFYSWILICLGHVFLLVNSLDYVWTKPVGYEVFKAGALHDGSFFGLLDGLVAGGSSAAACSIAT